MNKTWRGAKKSKLMWVGLATTILGAVEASLHLFSEVLTPTGYGLLTMAIGVAVAILRMVTTQPLGDK